MCAEVDTSKFTEPQIIIEVGPHDLRSLDGAFLFTEEELEGAAAVIASFQEVA